MINYTIISPETTIRNAIKKIDDTSSNGGVPGIAVIVDSSKTTLGVLTDGDIRKLFCQDVDFETPVEKVMSKEFVHTFDDLDSNEQLNMISEQFNISGKKFDPRVSKVIVCNRDKKFNEIINLIDLYTSEDIQHKSIAVFGMGYVGLTLALTMAESGLNVYGVDIKPELISQLNKKQAPFFENGLDSLLNQCVDDEQINFVHSEDSFESDIYFIAVGTPVNQEGEVLFNYLEQAGHNIGKRLKKGDLVICRSTVPIGTTRSKLIPVLEKSSGLIAGQQFHISFAPERTVEGNAIRELRTLPQVIGGLTKQCSRFTSKVFEVINPTIVKVDSLESAELVKLVNNTYRDTAFSFANDVALLCEDYNINAFEVIKAANEGYPRNPIPLPSPGVGGICLVKDPYLYMHSRNSDRPGFGSFSRDINTQMPGKIYSKFMVFCEQHNIKPKSIFIIGLAFKGLPETSDMRYSPALDLAALFKAEGITIYGSDQVVPTKEIEAEKIIVKDTIEGIKEADAVFVMNNHPGNTKFDVYQTLKNKEDATHPFFFFDGWNQFSRHEIESINNVYFSTLGYTTI